jgi:hypothetical protein
VGHSRVVYLKDKMKLSLRVINEAPRHWDVRGSVPRL